MARNYITVSFTIGSKKHAIQTKEKLKKINNHNHRNFKKSYNNDLDLSKSKDNIILIGSKNIVKDIEKFYKEEFSEAVYNYNQKQKRNDRKIVDYLDKVSEDSKKNVAIEMILQLGDREDWENVSLEDKKKMAEVFKSGIELLNDRNLKVANAVVHLDEASPHLHLIAVPIGVNFKTGMEKQVSTSAVLDKKKLYKLRKDMENTLVAEYNKVYDKNLVKREEKGIIDKHLDPADYKEVKPILDELIKVADKNITLTKIKENLSNKDKEIDTLKKKLENKEAEEKELKEKKKISEALETEVEKQNFKIERLEKEKKTNETILFIAEDIVKGLTENINKFEEERKKLEKEKVQKEKEKEEAEAIVKAKTKELEEIRQNRANVDELIEKEKEKREKINNKEEVLKILDKRIDDLSKNIGERKQKIEEAEAEEERIVKKEKELEEKREERVLKNREKVIYETIEYLENDNINLNEKDYFFRKVPYLEENLSEKDKGLFVGYVTSFFKTIKSNLENYKEEYKEILKEIKTEVLKGARAFNNFVRETYFNIEIDEEKIVSVKEKEKVKASDEKEKEKEKEKDYIEY